MPDTSPGSGTLPSGLGGIVRRRRAQPGGADIQELAVRVDPRATVLALIQAHAHIGLTLPAPA